MDPRLNSNPSGRQNRPGRSGRPVIGIAAAELRDAETIRKRTDEDPSPRETATGVDYVHAVSASGAVPIVLPVVDPAEVADQLAIVDALCLPGGADLDPSFYGEETGPRTGPCDPELDRFQLALTEAALALDLPLLAICRGIQVLNVALGGTLIQDLPSLGDAVLPHRQPESGDVGTQEVTFEPDSRLAGLAGGETAMVNTFHHQAIAVPAETLRPVAHSRDGVIEAVEKPGSRFTVGVQWHAELMPDDPLTKALFGALAGAASGRDERDSRVLP